jgi:FkbM family methyltransferase
MGEEIMMRGSIEGTWIDVGAHHGETTLGYARHNPGLRVFAFEPNLAIATKLMGHAPNYIVIPMAVAERDGSAQLHINAFDAASSLLALNEVSLKEWTGGESLKITSTSIVPTIRLDTFMRLADIKAVDYLKIDTQGMDLAVVKSAGSRLPDITKITLEVDIKPVPLYTGAPSKDEVLAFLNDAGFSLVSVEKQTHGQEENLTFLRKRDVRRLRDDGSNMSAMPGGH